MEWLREIDQTKSRRHAVLFNIPFMVTWYGFSATNMIYMQGIL